MDNLNYTTVKKLFLVLLILPAWLSQASASNNMTISGGEVATGSTIMIDLLIDNSDEFVGFQVDIPIPEQLTYVNNSAFLNPDRTTDHMLQASIIEGNILRIFSFSFMNSAFVGNSGPVLSFELMAGNQSGVFSLEPTNALISSAGGENILHHTFPGTITILGTEILKLDEHTIGDGDEGCFDSNETIITGGDGGWFWVQQGGSATLIAGNNIKMLPGTTVENGGHLLARIATHDDDFCQIPEATKIAKEPIGKRDDMIPTGFSHETSEKDFFRIYPNPADGILNLEITGANLNQDITVEFYCTIGGHLFSKNLPLQRLHTLSLDELQSGMYIVKVINGDKTGIQRLIKR